MSKNSIAIQAHRNFARGSTLNGVPTGETATQSQHSQKTYQSILQSFIEETPKPACSKEQNGMQAAELFDCKMYFWASSLNPVCNL